MQFISSDICMFQLLLASKSNVFMLQVNIVNRENFIFFKNSQESLKRICQNPDGLTSFQLCWLYAGFRIFLFRLLRLIIFTEISLRLFMCCLLSDPGFFVFLLLFELLLINFGANCSFLQCNLLGGQEGTRTVGRRCSTVSRSSEELLSLVFWCLGITFA